MLYSLLSTYSATGVSMASRGTSGKPATTRRKTATSGGAKRSSAAVRRKADEQPLLSPQHQRELFALFLITIAMVTLVFFVTGQYGGIGKYYVEGVRQAFGAGSLVVPLTLGVIGIAILIQERFKDTSLTAGNLLGTLFTLGAILGLLEFPRHAEPIAERVGQGGGLIGFTLVDILDKSIGRPAAVLVVLVIGLAGVILTFNITLRELLAGLALGLNKFWLTLWSAPRRAAKPAAVGQPAAVAAGEALPFLPPPGIDDDIQPTPIAERPARASLFQRAVPSPAPAQPAAKTGPATPPAAPAKKNAPAATTLGAANPATTRPAPPSSTPAPINEVVQEALDGFDVPAVQRAWPLPGLDGLLERPADGGITDDERRIKARLIEETLASFKVEARVVGVNTGPAVTQFELQPAVGVKVNKITTLDKDLALALAAQSIRIEAPIPGKNVVGIEIPNSSISLVTIREVLDSEEFEANRGKLKLPLGKDVSGTPVIADMAKMPHLLVAGSTGSGKSVAINAFLCGLLLKHTPDELKLILVDPKMVEMIVYNQIPHLLSPVVTEIERVVPTLKWATREMERRYKVFARHGCRNLDTYRTLARRRSDLEPMPYILIIIDELADLMMMAADEVETYICRLAQMARATGIHLIIATQRPSVDVITGLIKANFPSRIAFAVTSQVDSRVILDTPGAEQLLGKGDMLYMAADAAKMVRIQGTYVADREVEQIVHFWRNAQPPEAGQGDKVGTPHAASSTASSAANTASTAASASATSHDSAEAFTPPAQFLSADEQDDLLPQATKLVKQHQRASASMLARRMNIGYSKAAQLIDLLEQQGVVGPAEGGRSREVLQQEE
jgi:DNA segregation ATPase FtsK/SpoIIIE, S-DNA-T family